MPSNGALSERNERVKYARTLGIDKPHLLKKDALEDAIATAEAKRAEIKAAKLAAKFDDPFDDIDPTVEGDHLSPDVLPDVETVAEALSLRDSVREVWLLDAVAELKAVFRQAGHPQVADARVLISTGFPQGNVRKIIGQCHHADFNDGIAHIFINPTQDDTLRVLEIVAHELAHAPGYKTHTGKFRDAAMAVGLKGTGGPTGRGFTSTDITDDARPVFEDIASRLGPYPHTRVNLAVDGGGGKKTQSTRMLKATCEAEDCLVALDAGGKYTIRLSKKWAELGLPTCPCGQAMVLDAKDDGGE